MFLSKDKSSSMFVPCRYVFLYLYAEYPIIMIKNHEIHENKTLKGQNFQKMKL